MVSQPSLPKYVPESSKRRGPKAEIKAPDVHNDGGVHSASSTPSGDRGIRHQNLPFKRNRESIQGSDNNEDEAALQNILDPPIYKLVHLSSAGITTAVYTINSNLATRFKRPDMEDTSSTRGVLILRPDMKWYNRPSRKETDHYKLVQCSAKGETMKVWWASTAMGKDAVRIATVKNNEVGEGRPELVVRKVARVTSKRVEREEDKKGMFGTAYEVFEGWSQRINQATFLGEDPEDVPRAKRQRREGENRDEEEDLVESAEADESEESDKSEVSDG